MATRDRPQSRLRFEDYELDPVAWELWRDGERLPLSPQPVRLLALLAGRAGELVTRDEIRDWLWSKRSVVEFDQGLHSCVRKIRQALGDDAQHPRYLETLPGRGYRFLAVVEPAGEPESAGARRGRAAVVAAAAISALAAGAFFLWWAPQPQPVLIAILPPAVADTALEAFGVGFSERLNDRLRTTAPERLVVLAHGSTRRLSDDRAPGLLERIRADYHLETGVERIGAGLRVTSRLIDASSGVERWSGTFVAENAGRVAGADLAVDMAGAIAAALVPGHAGRGLDAAVTDPVAMEAFLAGRFLAATGDGEDLIRSEARFEQAVSRVPRFADAWAALAETRIALAGAHLVPPPVGYAGAILAAEEALRLNPDLAVAHHALGYARLYGEWDFDAAGRHFRRALELEPGLARAHSGYAAWLSARGRHGDAVEQARLARRLDPLTQLVNADLCWLLNYAGRFDEARRSCEDALALDENDGWTLLGVAEAARQLGDHEREAGALARAFGGVAAPEADAESIWRALRDRLAAADTIGGAQAYLLAVACARIGETEQAMSWLRTAVAERVGFAVFINVDSRLSSLRNAPRFSELVRDVGLDPTA